MKKFIIPCLLLFCCAISAQEQSPFNTLQNLTGGTWQMQTKKGLSCEQWTVKSATELSGTGFRIAGKDTLIQERVKLIKKTDGIYYIPTVTNQNAGKEVEFKLTSTTNNEYIFANPAHDFPQRVVYKFISTDSLHAWVDGKYNGKFVKQDFYYKRVK